jgi:transposase
MSSAYGTVAGIDVHKQMVVVVVLQSTQPDRDYATGRFGTTRFGLAQLAGFLQEHHVTSVAMESTAQYWRPVWMALEGEFALTLTQARATRAPRGRKRDVADERRIAKRLLSGDLTVSFVPGPQQREWRLLARTQVAMLEAVVRLRNQIEVVLEQAQIKLSSVVSDLLGLSGRRILHALIEGVSDGERLAALGDRRLRASREELADALSGRVSEAQRLVLKLYLEEIEQTERHMADVDLALAVAEGAHHDAITRLCGIPGISVHAAQQIVAEIGPAAEAFDSADKLASWVGVCPGSQESAGVSVSDRSAKGNRMMRRVLSQIAWAAIASKGSEAQRRYRRWVIRLGPQKAAWAVAHYTLRVIWKVLHQGVRYIPPDTSASDRRSLLRRANRVLADLRKLGYQVSINAPEAAISTQAT